MFCTDSSPTAIYPLPLHDALPISQGDLNIRSHISTGDEFQQLSETLNTMLANLKTSSDQLRAVNKSLDMKLIGADRKSTRLNSSHANISYAVFCLKKKKKNKHND